MEFWVRLLILIILYGSALLSGAAQVGDGCSTDGDCGSDGLLHCDSCGSVCTRIKPTDPESVNKGLPFNRYSWLTTHNSYAIAGSKSATGSELITFTNQQDTVTSQLQNGVRGLMLDMYEFLNDIWLCHSFGGKCYNFTAFEPAVNTLKEVGRFLDGNPQEVITIFIEDYVNTPKGVSKVLDAAGLSKYMFPVSAMPSNSGDWPLLSDIINANHRLLVFSSKRNKEASDGIAYQWNYVLENQYGDGGMKAGSCPNRGESSPINSHSRSLLLMNYFPDNPNSTAACLDNSTPLLGMLDDCHSLSGGRWPNYISIDFYKEGGPAQAPDIANGHMLCGCNTLALCIENATFGSCKLPPPTPPTRPSNSRNPSSSQAPSSSDAAHHLLPAKKGSTFFFFFVLLLISYT